MKIMAVDDNATNLEIIRVLLRSTGHAIVTATCGEEALVVARQELPDLVFMDLALPGAIDGLEATRRLKGDPATRHMVVVALTAMVTSGDQAQALAAGCDAFVRKPYTRRQLLDFLPERPLRQAEPCSPQTV